MPPSFILPGGFSLLLPPGFSLLLPYKLGFPFHREALLLSQCFSCSAGVFSCRGDFLLRRGFLFLFLQLGYCFCREAIIFAGRFFFLP